MPEEQALARVSENDGCKPLPDIDVDSQIRCQNSQVPWRTTKQMALALEIPRCRTYY
jgi:hypothetical protein